MEQAVNQFNKGLLSDTHPMVLGNDTLSDALNATFVTMNGNEVVLQNDMGNRRVDNAFLPPGYEPVGIKEYGGIIYVASYNPITGRSLIGSFPSPERKINSLDDESLGCNFGLFNDFIDRAEIGKNGFKFITSDTILYPLTGETSLHAGDKFAIYSDSIETWKPYLTNYNNATGINGIKKAILQKNRSLTLSVGVLNSLNQFIDITKNLKRWNNSKVPSTEIKYDDTYSENYIFNDGYFISRTGFDDPSLYTKNDRELIRERLVNPANTYAYKLVGPLYLKSQLNHIQEFSYNVSGDKGKNILIEPDGEHEYNYINLEITATIKYNCPDYVFEEGNENENYFDDGCGSPIKNFQGWEPFKFFRRGDYGLYSGDNIEKSYTYGTPIYDNGLYTVNVKLKLKDKKYTKDINGKLEYFIGVDSGIPIDQTNNESYFIETLSSYGEIDLSKLNSGDVYLNYFRFFNNIDESNSDNNSTTISLGIEAYPKLDLKFTNLKLFLNDVEDEDPEIMIDISDILYNGKIVKTINWNNYNIEKGKLYKVTSFEYDDDLNPKLLHIRKKDSIYYETRWLLTTKLFNDCYNPLSDNFVEDFGERVYNPDTIEYNSNFTDKQKEDNKKLYNKLAVKLSVLSDDSSITVESSNEKKDGNLIIKTLDSNGSIMYSVTKSYTITKLFTDKIVIKNPELYPNFIELENNSITCTYNNLSILLPSIEIFNKNTGEITVSTDNVFTNIYVGRAVGRGNTDISNSSGIPIIDYNFQNSSKYIKVLFNCNNLICSPKNGTKTFKNGFVKINSDYFRNYILERSVSHSGFFVGNYDHYGPDDEHYIGLICDYPNLSVPIQWEDFNKMTHSKCIPVEGPKIFDFSDLDIGNFYDAMNSSIGSKYTFAYIFSGLNVGGRATKNNETEKYCPQIIAYVPNFNTDRNAGLRADSNNVNNGVTVESSVYGYCPITACKVWWRNGISDNWVLLNSKSGIFGAPDSLAQEFKFPFDIKINNDKRLYVYVGLEEWKCDTHNVYLGFGDNSTTNDPKDLYNALYLGITPTELNLETGSSSNVNDTGGSASTGGRGEQGESNSGERERYKDTIKLALDTIN